MAEIHELSRRARLNSESELSTLRSKLTELREVERRRHDAAREAIRAVRRIESLLAEFEDIVGIYGDFVIAWRSIRGTIRQSPVLAVLAAAAPIGVAIVASSSGRVIAPTTADMNLLVAGGLMVLTVGTIAWLALRLRAFASTF